VTDKLRCLIQQAGRELAQHACQFDGHDWISEGGRSCPMGAEGCSQAVYVCRSCGAYDHGDTAESPGKHDCQVVCGDSMMGWRNGHLDPSPDYGLRAT